MVAKAKAPTARAPTIGATVDQLWAAREEKRRLEGQVKEVETKIDELQTSLMERMDAEGIAATKGNKASASITETVTADVQDWEGTFWPWVAKKKHFHLIQRRVNDAAYRELLELGEKVPGVQSFTKRKLNLRSI